jgi:hypothetical protein
MAYHGYAYRNGIALRNGIAYRNGYAVARPNPLFGKGYFFGMPVTKKAQHANALGNEAHHRNKYNECKKKRKAKGKSIYPADPKGKCKKQYKKWNKWRGKAGKKAAKVMAQAEKRGYLTDEAQAFLEADMARAMGTDTNAASAMAAGMDETSAENFLSDDFTVGGIPSGQIAIAATVLVGLGIGGWWFMKRV